VAVVAVSVPPRFEILREKNEKVWKKINFETSRGWLSLFSDYVGVPFMA
jgi:hypothetical protein